MSGPEFIRDGLCAQTDPEVFFPEKSEPAAPAKKVCRRCPVLRSCRDYALDRPELVGVWGGMTAKERERARAAGKVVTA